MDLVGQYHNHRRFREVSFLQFLVWLPPYSHILEIIPKAFRGGGRRWRPK
jgi:hypothetical protein